MGSVSGPGLVVDWKTEGKGWPGEHPASSLAQPSITGVSLSTTEARKCLNESSALSQSFLTSSTWNSPQTAALGVLAATARDPMVVQLQRSFLDQYSTEDHVVRRPAEGQTCRHSCCAWEGAVAISLARLELKWGSDAELHRRLRSHPPHPCSPPRAPGEAEGGRGLCSRCHRTGCGRRCGQRMLRCCAGITGAALDRCWASALPMRRFGSLYPAAFL